MPGAFELAISQFAQKAGDNADKAVRQVVLTIAKRLIERSPVDTGRFRSNWFFSSGMPTSRVSASNTLKVVNDIDDAQNAKAGQVFYLSNNLPYAYRLEINGATKARNALGQIAGPSGIVGLTVLDFEAIVDDAVKDLDR